MRVGGSQAIATMHNTHTANTHTANGHQPNGHQSANGHQPADEDRPRPVEERDHRYSGGVAMPQALRDRLAAAGVEETPSVRRAAEVLVRGRITARTRARYGRELGIAAQWCAEHGLELLDLPPLDMAALAVASREGGCDPDMTLTALGFLYRHKPDPDEHATILARRVDRVWKAQNRHRLNPPRRAPVLPLGCWAAMRDAVDRPGYITRAHEFNSERMARDRLLISLGVSGGLRPGEPGRLSASKSSIDHHGRLVLPLVAGSPDAVTKTGRIAIVVPVEQPPFDAFPLADDFERLKALRLRRSSDDHLFAGAWHHGMSGGLTEGQVRRLLRKMADKAGIADGAALSGHSMRRSMVHIAAAAGWPLESIAGVVGHRSTQELENCYLEGYGGTWSTSREGSALLLEGSAGWADWPINLAAAARTDPAAPTVPQQWWVGRDLQADRATAAALARRSPRTSHVNDWRAVRAGRMWRAFCDEAGADAARPSLLLLEAFATSWAEESTTCRADDIRYLTDHFAALELIAVEDLARIAEWVSAATKLAEKVTAANRRQTRTAPRRRQIADVTDEAMERIFDVALTSQSEALRLNGLVIEQGRHHIDLSSAQREAFRFGRDTRITAAAAELLDPGPMPASVAAGLWQRPAAVTVTPRGGSPLWCGYEAARTLAARYPHKSLYSHVPPEAWTSRCTPLMRWLRARAAVAVLHATGLRPTDLDGFRWADLAYSDDGCIMWRLPHSKGNVMGDRIQVLPLVPSDRPWCPVKALQALAGSLAEARAAGWSDPTASPDDGDSVFAPRIGRSLTKALLKPAGVDVRPQDFRYRTASTVWEATGSMQAVKATLFHRQAQTSAVYVARGMPPQTRLDTDPLKDVFASAAPSAEERRRDDPNRSDPEHAPRTGHADGSR